MANPYPGSYSPEETARRRDEVIRRMANTPPQPRVTPKSKVAKPTGEGPTTRKSDGEGPAKPNGNA